MATDKDFQAMKKAVCLLLDHAIYDEERDDNCIAAVTYARRQVSNHPNKKTQNAMRGLR